MEISMKEVILNIAKQQTQQKIAKIAPIDRPIFVIVVNGDDDVLVRHATQINGDCNDIGIGVITVMVNSYTSLDFIERNLKDYNDMKEVAAIMLQHPFPISLREHDNDFINLVDSNKLLEFRPLDPNELDPMTRATILAEIVNRINFV